MRVLLSVLIVLAGLNPALADTSVTKYKPAEIKSLTNFMLNTSQNSLSKQNEFLDYIRIAACDIYDIIIESPFKQEAVKTALAAKIGRVNPTEMNPLYVKTSSYLLVSGYNFETQSLTLTRNSTMKKVNKLQIIESDEKFCKRFTSSQIMTLPLTYSLKLNFPISLYRIPMKKSLAESILPKLDKSQEVGENGSVIYTVMYLQIDPSKPTIEAFSRGREGVFNGQVDIIDLYADPDHKVLLKRLNYAASY